MERIQELVSAAFEAREKAFTQQANRIREQLRLAKTDGYSTFADDEDGGLQADYSASQVNPAQQHADTARADASVAAGDLPFAKAHGRKAGEYAIDAEVNSSAARQHFNIHESKGTKKRDEEAALKYPGDARNIILREANVLLAVAQYLSEELKLFQKEEELWKAVKEYTEGQ